MFVLLLWKQQKMQEGIDTGEMLTFKKNQSQVCDEADKPPSEQLQAPPPAWLLALLIKT